jgi:hypothetical protein
MGRERDNSAACLVRPEFVRNRFVSGFPFVVFGVKPESRRNQARPCASSVSPEWRFPAQPRHSRGIERKSGIGATLSFVAAPGKVGNPSKAEIQN